MDALLILGGVLMILSGLVLLVTLAFGTSLLWGLGSLFPPLTLVYVIRYWKRARKALVLAGIEVVQPAQLTRVVQPGAQPKTLQDA